MDEGHHLSISVALCTRNGALYIGAQIDSILAQTLPPTQIVVSDDDSQDDTVALIVTALSMHPRIELVVLKNSPALGVVANFEQATKACTGDLIALCDQDDVWRSDRLETVRRYFEDNPDVSLVSSDARLVDGDGGSLGSTLFSALEVTSRELKEVNSGRGYECLLRRNIVTGATTVFRREVLTLALPFPNNWVHDEWIAIIAAATGRIDIVRRPLIDYRQHHSNAIGVARPTIAEKIAKLMVPRAERNYRLAARARDLVDRLQQLPDVRPALVEAARRKLKHEQMRESLPATRPRRIPPIARAVFRGDYRAYSRGKRDILRDLVQPA